ncbi:MAG: hypothetical protein KatS3mg083_270 [Candidatus Dojkabacteria bacterium]|nr:MAG: hypothetical protein KatS3mg083_270 [Candidatus Dojkabacteria bacterium]
MPGAKPPFFMDERNAMNIDKHLENDKFFGLSRTEALEAVKEVIDALSNGLEVYPKDIIEKYGINKSNAYHLYKSAMLFLQIIQNKDDVIEDMFSKLDIPDPDTYLYSDKKYVIDGPAKIGVLSDVHIPFFDKSALIAALKYLKNHKITHLVLLGDFVDFYAISFWEKSPDRRQLKKEVDMARQMLYVLREIFPVEKIIYVEGNHENRWYRYMMKNAPEIYGIDDFEVEKILRLSDYKIEYLSGGTFIEAGKLSLIHGHEYRSYASINIAVSYLRKSFKNIMLGHFHQPQEYIQRKIDGDIEGAWVVGCLCDLRPAYMPNNNWTHGFALVEVESDRSFVVINKKIFDSKVV